MKKYFYIIITALIICLITLIVLLIIYINNKNKVKPGDEMITTPGEQLSFELNYKIFPQDYLAFEQKTKSLKINHDEIYKSLYRFIKNGEQLKKDTVKMNDKELKDYYNYNYKTLNLRGIRTEEDFVKIVTLLRKTYTRDEIYYRNVKIVTKDKDNYEIEIEYNNNKTIKLNLIIINAEKSIFKFVPIGE